LCGPLYDYWTFLFIIAILEFLKIGLTNLLRSMSPVWSSFGVGLFAVVRATAIVIQWRRFSPEVQIQGVHYQAKRPELEDKYLSKE